MENVGKAEKGKMLVVEVKFWRHRGDRDLKKHIKGAGIVVVKRNKYHGIKRKETIFFNSLNDVPNAIEKALIRHEVVIHLQTKRTN